MRWTAPGARTTPIVCLQNGVENERLALRRFPDVYGAVIMAPTGHLQPGTVEAYGAKASGIIDVGRYPDGVDDVCERGGRRRSAPRSLSPRARPDIMRLKYAKLILNLGNAVGALCDAGRRSPTPS